MDETVTQTIDNVPREWLEALAEHYESEQAYFEHEGEPDTAGEWRDLAEQVRLVLRVDHLSQRMSAGT